VKVKSPNIEARNPKQIRMSKQRKISEGDAGLVCSISAFEFAICFVLRISNFEFGI